MVDGASSLDWRFRALHGEGARQWQWRGWLQGEGTLGSLSSLVGKGALATAVVAVAFGHIGVIDRTVVPKIGVPLQQDAVGVVAVDVWGRTLATPMAHM
jgi:hypothetical protein